MRQPSRLEKNTTLAEASAAARANSGQDANAPPQTAAQCGGGGDGGGGEKRKVVSVDFKTGDVVITSSGVHKTSFDSKQANVVRFVDRTSVAVEFLEGPPKAEWKTFKKEKVKLHAGGDAEKVVPAAGSRLSLEALRARSPADMPQWH